MSAAPTPPAEAPGWEQQPGETGRAYAAFCVYRDMGPTRSLAKAAEAFYQGKTRAKVAQMETWSSTYQWVDRAKLWDAHLDQIRRAEREEAHRAEIAEFKDRQRKLAAASLQAAVGLLALVNAKLRRMAEKKQELSEKSLASVARAAASVATVATDAEAHALSVGDLLQMLEELEAKEEDDAYGTGAGA